MFEILQQIWIGMWLIWNADGADAFWQQWAVSAIGSVMLCMPVYLVIFGMRIFGPDHKALKSFFDKVLGWTVAINALLVLMPIIFPCLAVYCLGSLAWSAWPHVRRLVAQPRPNPPPPQP